MTPFTDLEVRKDTIELMQGDRIASRLEVLQRYKVWEENQFTDQEDLLWISYFAAYNNRRAYLQEAGA